MIVLFLLCRSHLGNEEAEELTSPERRRSVSRRLSASFSAMQNAASGEGDSQRDEYVAPVKTSLHPCVMSA